MATYFGQVKTISPRDGSFQEFQSISFSKKDILNMEENLNEKGYINLNLNLRKQVGTYGETHTITLNERKPQNQDIKPTKAPNQDEMITIEDVPF